MSRRIDNILDILPDLISRGSEKLFYHCTLWVSLRDKVMSDFHNECVRCRARVIITRAVVGHHVYRLKYHPEYALSRVIAVDERTKMKVNSLAQNESNIFTIALKNGVVLRLVCIDKKREMYVNVDTYELLQILPVCSMCHKEIHTTDRVDELSKKFPERW